MTSGLYDVRRSEDLANALRDLRGFWKLWSGCLLALCGLRTLRGYILTSQHPNPVELFRNLGSKTFLIRHDKCLERPSHPRGGFLVGEEMLEETIDFFFGLDRIVGVYEPADPLLNMHNMNLLFESDREICVEVVGPGFDASDLQRGDLSPHETFSVRLTPDGALSDVKLIRRVDQASYRKSVIRRKDKIRRKLDSAPSDDLARRIRQHMGISEDLDDHLQEIGSPLCEFQYYRPVSGELLESTVTAIVNSRVIEQYRTNSGAGFPLVFSTSFVNKGIKQVYWDIVSPELKFEGLKTN